MAHLPDGLLSLPVLVGGALIALAGTSAGLRRLPPEAVPRTALLAAVFFVAALIHFPVGPSSVHLLLNGLVGVMLGWAAFPAILVGVLLQAVLFGFGGIAVLGVNIAVMAVPAVLCGALVRPLLSAGRWGAGAGGVMGGLAGGLGVLLTACAVAVTLSLSGQEFATAARLVIIAHLPVAVIEAMVSGAAVTLLLRVRPDFFADTGEPTTDPAPVPADA